MTDNNLATSFFTQTQSQLIPQRKQTLHCWGCSICHLAIHKQASVHARLLDLQEQLRVHPEVVHLHLVNSVIPDGAGLFVISTGTRLPLSNFYPFPSGEGIS